MEEKFEQEFLVTSPAHLVVKNIRGLVEIHPGKEDSIRVTAIKHTDSGDARRTEIEISQEDDGTVKAISRFPEGSIDWLFGVRPCKVDLIIQAPSQCNLKVSGVSNDARLSGFQGDIDIHSVSGGIILSNLSGTLNISTVSGDIDIEHLQGKIKLNTVSGNIKGQQASGFVRVDTVSGNVNLRQSILPKVEAESVSGDVELQTSLGEGPYRFHSVSGRVRLTIPAGSSFSAELHSISGRISTTHPAKSLSRHHGTEIMEVLGGGVKVSLDSVSGDLSLVS